MFDALRADRVGVFGNEHGLTPFLDSLAEHAYVFHRAYSAAPYTVASIASLLSSRLPSQHGVVWFRAVLADDEVTLPEVLHEQGYVTGLFTGNLLFAGVGQGFDAAEVVTEPGHTCPQLARVAGSALAWLKRLPRPPVSPTFMYLHFMDTHAPYEPRIEMVHRVAAGKRALDPATVNQRATRPRALSTDELRDLRDVYDASVMTADAALRQFLTGYGPQQFLDDSIIVVTADHGEELGDHGLIGHGGVVYESSVRVPLLIALPGQTRRIDVHEVVSLLDVAPTIADLLDTPVPARWEGRPLTTAVQRRDHPWQLASLWDRLRHWTNGPPGADIGNLVTKDDTGQPDPPHLRAIVRGSHKLVVGSRGERLYYDLAIDPGETNPDALTAADRADLDHALARVEERARYGSTSHERIELDEDTKQKLKALGYTTQ